MPTPTQRAAIEGPVCKLLEAHRGWDCQFDPQIEAWERELNALVYEAYGLTDEEIAVFERR